MNELLTTDKKLYEQLVENYHAGIQQDTEATCTNFGENVFIEEQIQKKQIVTQVYVSACSVTYSLGDGDPEMWRIFSSLILDCIFEFTLHTAFQNALRHQGEKGSKKVFLCPVGGGVFGNDMSWIVGAIQKALNKFKDIGLDVYLVSRSPKIEYEQILKEFC